MIDRGMDNQTKCYLTLWDAQNRIEEIKSGKKEHADDDAKYFAEVQVDLSKIEEPMIADPDVNNMDIQNAIHMTLSDLYPVIKQKKR